MKKNIIYCLLEDKKIDTEKCMDCPGEIFPCEDFAEKFKIKTDNTDSRAVDKSIEKFLDFI